MNRRLFSRFFYKAFESMSGTTLPDGAGDFRLLDRKAADAMNRFGERARFNKGLYAWIGSVEFATLRWLEHHEVDRAELLSVVVGALPAGLFPPPEA